MKKCFYDVAVTVGLILLILFLIQIPASAFIPDGAIIEYIQNISTKSEITQNILGLSFGWKDGNQVDPEKNRILENSVKLPNHFKNIQDFYENSESIQIIGDNYSIYPTQNSNINEIYIPLEKWKDIPLDWVLFNEPEGTIIVSMGMNNPDNKKITIPSGTIEKGILLYSAFPVPLNEPGFSFFINGNISNRDSLVFLVKDTANPDNMKLFSIPPGNYSNSAYINLTEFSGHKTSLVLGACFLSEQEYPWIITRISLGNTNELTNNSDTLFISDNQTDKLPLNEEIPTIDETKYPNISKIYPVNILNIQTHFSINIYGEHFLPGVKVWIADTDSEEVYSKNVTVVSENNISAVFSDLNLPSDSYSVTITNPDGNRATINNALTIHTPNKPEILEISPNNGPNSGIFNVTTLNISHFSYGDSIYLNRKGFFPIYATNIQMLTNDTLSCKFDLDGESVGYWNLTIKKPNGKYDTCVDCFSITGPDTQYYSYLYDMILSGVPENENPVIEGLAIDSTDNIFISDSSRNVIQKFSPDGMLIREWGGTGNNTGDFSYPGALAISKTGNVYVIDKGIGRIQKFNSDGIFQTAWGSKGSEKGQFINPCGLTLDNNENVYVCDTNNHRIQKFSGDGVFLMSWGSQGGFVGQFNFPTGVVSGINETVYVIDNGNDRIQQFDMLGNYLAGWGGSGTKNGEFLYPGSIAKDSLNNIYITDLTRHQIQKFDPDGIFLSKWGSFERDEGNFLCPDEIAINSSGFVYLTDCIANQIQVYQVKEDSQFFNFYSEKKKELFSDNFTLFPEG